MNSATLAVPTLEERRPRSNGATEQQDDENTAMIDEDEEQVEAEEAEDKEVGRVGERDAEDGRSVVSDRYDFEVTRLSRDATRYSVRVKEGGRTTVPKGRGVLAYTRVYRCPLLACVHSWVICDSSPIPSLSSRILPFFLAFLSSWSSKRNITEESHQQD